MKRLLFYTVLLLVPPMPGYAEMYRWVDENGKVHFSDRVDGNTSQQADRIDSQRPAETMLPDSSSDVPIVRPFDALARKVYISDVVYAWKLTTMDRSRVLVGSYHVDSSCMSRGNIVLPDAYIQHGDFFPEESSLSHTVMRFMRGLDYDVDTTQANDLIPKLRKSGALGLRAEISKINLNACAKSRRSYDNKNPANQLSASSYRTSSAEIEINWSLIDGSGNELFAVTTRGGSGGWKDKAPGITLSDSVENAARQLMADKRFVSRLMIEQRAPIAEKANRDGRVIPPNYNGDLYREIGLSIEGRSWATRYGQNRNIGELSFGGECNARTSLDWLSANTHYENFLPDAQNLSATLSRSLRDIGYPVKNLQSVQWPQKNAETPYLLRATITDSMVTACAPRRDTNAAFLRPGQVPLSEFSRFSTSITIDWQLIERDSGNVLFSLTTNSDGGDFVLTRRYNEVAQDAWHNAAAELFSDPRFIEQVRLQSFSEKKSEPFPVVTNHSMPKLRPESLNFPGLLLVQEDYDFLEKLDSGQVIGAIYAEKSCDMVKSLGVDGLRGLNSHAVSIGAHSFLNQLDYMPRMSTAVGYQKQQRAQGYYLLRPTVSRLRIDVCQPMIDRQSVLAGQSHGNRRHRAMLEVEWLLTSPDGETVVYRSDSRGVAGGWQTESKIADVVSSALVETIKPMLNDPAFTSALQTVGSEKAGFIENWFGDLSDLDELLSPRAYQAKGPILMALFSIKSRSVEYHLTHRKWPVSLAQIDQDISSIDARNHISAITMDGAGEIRMDLGGSIFEPGDIILLRWNRASRDYQFDCLTNHRALSGENCKEF